MSNLKNIEFHGRKADIHYSLPKDGEKDSNQATVEVELAGTQDFILNEQLYVYMSKYGDIRSVRDIPSNPQ